MIIMSRAEHNSVSSELMIMRRNRLDLPIF